jgi:phospholipase C
VIWIWFENKSSDRVAGSASAPYFNSLAKQCAYAANFHNVSHPSLPNYLGATSGRTDGVARDCSPASCSSTSTSLFKQLQDAGLTWKGYAESMPRNCAIYDTKPYAARHNPPVYYTDIKNSCATNDVPLGSSTSGNLADDLTHGTLPNFSFITPNLCNDMHDCSVSTGDSWLKTWLTKIVNGPAYDSGKTAIFVTFDEGGGGHHGEDCASPTNNDKSCLIASYVLGPAVPAGLQVTTRLTQYSMLRTTEAMLGLKTFLGDAATATGMRQPFHL